MKFCNLLNDKYVKILFLILLLISFYCFFMNNREGFKLPGGIVIQSGRPNETRQNCTSKARTTCEKGKNGTVVCFNKCESLGEKLQRRREERDKKIEKLGWFERSKQKAVVFYEDATAKMSKSYDDLKKKLTSEEKKEKKEKK
jgi:hypothetical protein